MSFQELHKSRQIRFRMDDRGKLHQVSGPANENDCSLHFVCNSGCEYWLPRYRQNGDRDKSVSVRAPCPLCIAVADRYKFYHYLETCHS
jgi:hypothetical protein